jgi:hypothetical protein
VGDVVLKVVDKFGVWVVSYDDSVCAIESADQARESGAGTELEDSLLVEESGGVCFKVCGGGSAGVPKVVALSTSVDCELIVVMRWVGYEEYVYGTLIEHINIGVMTK